jgi:hypothetical protein
MTQLQIAAPFHLQCLRSEFSRRKLRNPSYSLRAFARNLGLDPSFLGRFLHGRQSLSPRACTQVLRRMQLPEPARDSFVASYSEEQRERICRKIRQDLGLPETRPPVPADHEQMLFVVHDLRNLLTSVLNTIAAYERERVLNPDSVTARRTDLALELIRSAAERMRYLVCGVLAGQKTSAGATVSGATIAGLEGAERVGDLLEQAVDLIRPVAAARHIEVDLRLQPGCAGTAIRCDREEIFRMLSNLLGNAVDFSPAGGRVALSATEESEAVTLSVADSGPGIEAADHERIFERYWQSDPAGSRGLGLGLSIARRVARAHGGEIWVDSAPGAGSTFHVRLPLAAPEAARSA